jgi:ABC-type dipeptide/oligopeptide/nickel transport system permease subunit
MTMALPWMFLLLTVRAILPLDTSPGVSVVITFTMMGLLGWAGPARVVRRRVLDIRSSDYIVAARARGVGPASILYRHVIPNLKPLLLAQFWSSIPVFILAEANLGMLGLGVNEPLPSWGSLLKGLEREVGLGNGFHNTASFAPLLLLMTVVGCAQIRFGSEVSK